MPRLFMPFSFSLKLLDMKKITYDLCAKEFRPLYFLAMIYEIYENDFCKMAAPKPCNQKLISSEPFVELYSNVL